MNDTRKGITFSGAQTVLFASSFVFKRDDEVCLKIFSVLGLATFSFFNLKRKLFCYTPLNSYLSSDTYIYLYTNAYLELKIAYIVSASHLLYITRIP